MSEPGEWGDAIDTWAIVERRDYQAPTIGCGMAVLLADGLYQVRRRAHPAERDAHGTPIPGPDNASVTDPTSGAAVEQPDGSWKLRLHPAVWPVRAGDTRRRRLHMDGDRHPPLARGAQRARLFEEGYGPC